MSAAARSCVLYARVSTDTGEQDPESQLHTLRAWCSSRGWRVAGEYSDRITGDPGRRRGDPPGLAQALAQLEKRRGLVLVIFSAERLVRSPWELIRYVARVQSLGGAVASYQDGSDLDTTTDEGEFSLIMKGWFARMFLKLNRRATLAGLARARAEGRIGGRRAVAKPTPEEVCAAERAIRDRGGEPSLTTLAAELHTSKWIIRCVRNPGFRKRRSSYGVPPAKEGV